MAFRHLSQVNAVRFGGGPVEQEPPEVSQARFSEVLERLRELERNDRLYGIAYGIIQDDLLAFTPPDERRGLVWKLGRALPSHFMGLIEYIVRNCP
jgi:hypothetical protein